MPYKNIEDRRAARSRWAKKNADYLAKKSQEYYQANKEHLVELRKERRITNPEQYEKDKKNTVAAMREAKRDIKSRLVRFFGGKCKYCRIEDDPCIFDFHHRDPNEKDMNIAALTTRTRNWDIVLKEAQKCDMICSNCHRKIHKKFQELS